MESNYTETVVIWATEVDHKSIRVQEENSGI